MGKTSIARSIAESLGRKYVRLSLGGVRDEAEIRGHRRTYIGAMPGKIISAMITAKSSNPLMLLDEIDKLAGDFRGDPAAALLEALTRNRTAPSMTISWIFRTIWSHVLFITTANDLGSIPGPLRDRMDVIELPSYTRVENTISPANICCLSSSNSAVCLERSRCRRALCMISSMGIPVRPVCVIWSVLLPACSANVPERSPVVRSRVYRSRPPSLEELLGPRQVKADFLNRTNMVGVANGLAWTSGGGETLPIEVQVMDEGSGKITVTGSLGDVMKESPAGGHLCAGPCSRIWHRPGAPEEMRSAYPCPPRGALPKDGPSAGVTLTTALVSCLSGMPVREMLP